MNFHFLRHLARRFAVLSSLCLVASGLVSCGGGGGGSDEGNPTVRPKTLDGIVLTMDGSKANFEFIRNSGTPAAVNNGDVETGTFIYTLTSPFRNLSTYDNAQGGLSNFLYPLSVSSATYTYRAVNDSSGVLTMVGVGTYDDFLIIIPPGGVVADRDSLIQPFDSASPGPFDLALTTVTTRVVQMDITFGNNGGFVSSDVVTFRLPESPFVNTLDTVRIQTNIRLATLGAVPPNYNPAVTERAPSRIAPASLANRLMFATNGIPDQTKDFSIQFVPDVASIPNPAADSTEIGKGILSVFDSSLVPPRLSPVTIALDYTWERIAGTDTGRLVLSNIPNNPALPFAVSLNGTLVLSFSGLETGTYTGNADADTPSAGDVTGSFFMPINAGPGVVAN
jgi:hypothetical protein